MNKLCHSPKTFAEKLNKVCATTSRLKTCEKMLSSDIHSVFISFDLKARAKNIRFDSVCKKFNYIKCKRLQSPSNDRIYAQKINAAIQLHTPTIEKKFNIACSAKSTKTKCLKFAKNYPGFKAKNDMDYTLLLLSQAFA